MNSLRIFTAASILVAFAAIKYIYNHILRPKWYLRNIHGVPGGTLLQGSMSTFNESEPGAYHRQWHQTYGHTFRYNSFFSVPRLCTTDKNALEYVLISEPYKFPKPKWVSRILAATLGEGLLVVEGTGHKRQRRIINPSFGPANIKSLYPIFVEKALRLCDALQKQMDDSPSTAACVDIYAYANRAALDVIGAAGFGYEINAIERDDENELAKAFCALFRSTTGVTVWHILTSFFPVLEQLSSWSPRIKATNNATSAMRRIGAQIVEERKRDVMTGVPIASQVVASSAVEANQVVGRDLLSILVKANLASGLKPSQKLSDKEVAAHISTFLLAGNETTACSLYWAIFGLCKYPETQRKLREEVLNFPGSPDLGSNMPTYDELNALPYLDAVVRETLRRYTPVVATSRTSTEDCLIPLAEPIVDRKGVKRTEIFIAKNTGIAVPIVHMLTNTSVWGPDAGEFKPERWLPDRVHLLPEGVMEFPSIAFPAFLAGPRACIGFRFTILEIKTMLFCLLRDIKFELAVPAADIEARVSIVNRPRIKSRRAEGWQLPVNIVPADERI